MSLQSLTSSARRSLQAYQGATNITGQNIANAETPGYTRRSVRIAQDPSVRGGIFFHDPAPGTVGGSGLAGIDRVRSTILDTAARTGLAGSAGAGTGASLLTALQSQLGPDGGDALLGSLSAFWGAWSDVADSPTSAGARGAVLSSGAELAGTLRGAAGRLSDLDTSIQQDLGASVDRVNDILGQVAGLNGAARAARAQGAPDLDAEDSRDALLDELAGLMPIAVRPQTDGTVTVGFGGMVGVQGTEAQPLRLMLPPAVAAPEVRAHGATRGLSLSGTEGGTVGAQLHTLTVDLPDARSALDTLAAQLVARVNAAHTAGTGADGATGRSFFDPTGTTAATLAVGPAMTGPDAVAAGTGQPGDSSVATTIAGLGEGVQSLAVALFADLGRRVRAATSAATANAAFADHALALRDGVSKVDMDEEMTNLIRYQQAYAASARVLNTANDLFDTLMSI